VILVLAALIGIVVGGIIAYAMLRRRRPQSIEDNLRNFRRGLDALDPAKDPLRERERVRAKNRRGRS
jgi:HAMP domain-containing protein